LVINKNNFFTCRGLLRAGATGGRIAPQADAEKGSLMGIMVAHPVRECHVVRDELGILSPFQQTGGVRSLSSMLAAGDLDLLHFH
jgi:hypothetical protein